MILDERDYNEEPKPRRKTADPVTRWDYCEVMGKIIGQPTVAVMARTKHWRFPDWFVEVKSYCREKDRVSQAKFINWYIRESRLKDINSDF